MTAWWMTTTRVRKVRVRSSAALRVVAFGTARISADAAELEMDVMGAPAGWSFQMLPPGTRFSKSHAAKCQGVSACWASTRPPGIDAGAPPAAFRTTIPVHPGFPGKVGQSFDFGQGAAIK